MKEEFQETGEAETANNNGGSGLGALHHETDQLQYKRFRGFSKENRG